MSIIGEFSLQKLSRDPNTSDYLNVHYEEKHRDVNEYVMTLKETFPHLQEMIVNKTVLDVGCSEGIETLAFSIMGAREVHGIDIIIDIKKNTEIQKQNANRKIKFSVMDAQNTSFTDQSFDIIVTCGSFEHFKSPYMIMKEFLL